MRNEQFDLLLSTGSSSSFHPKRWLPHRIYPRTLKSSCSACSPKPEVYSSSPIHYSHSQSPPPPSPSPGKMRTDCASWVWSLAVWGTWSPDDYYCSQAYSISNWNRSVYACCYWMNLSSRWSRMKNHSFTQWRLAIQFRSMSPSTTQ